MVLEQVFDLFKIDNEVGRIDSLNLIAVILFSAKGKFEQMMESKFLINFRYDENIWLHCWNVYER